MIERLRFSPPMVKTRVDFLMVGGNIPVVQRSTPKSKMRHDATMVIVTKKVLRVSVAFAETDDKSAIHKKIAFINFPVVLMSKTNILILSIEIIDMMKNKKPQKGLLDRRWCRRLHNVLSEYVTDQIGGANPICSGQCIDTFDNGLSVRNKTNS